MWYNFAGFSLTVWSAALESGVADHSSGRLRRRNPLTGYGKYPSTISYGLRWVFKHGGQRVCIVL